MGKGRGFGFVGWVAVVLCIVLYVMLYEVRQALVGRLDALTALVEAHLSRSGPASPAAGAPLGVPLGVPSP